MKENKNFIKGSKRTGGKYIPKGVGVQGVYIIYHDITNEFYIGKSCDINRRLSHHFGSLKRGENSNRKLQNLYDNSHKEDFSFDYIEVSEEEGYKHVEDYMIDKYKNDDRCLNASLPEGGWVKNPRMIETVDSFRKKQSEKAKTRVGDKNPFYGRSHTKETKEYLSRTFMGREHNSEAEPVVINGKKYRTLKEAGDALGLHQTTVLHRVRSDKPVFINWYKYVEGEEIEVKDDRLLFDPRIKTVRSLFEIEGEYYYNSLDISKKYGIARNTVSYRVESKNYERWKKLI